MKWLLITFLAIIAIYAQQPVPALTDGYVMGDPSAPRTLEMFVDFECPDSAGAWPVVKQVVQKYAGKMNLRVHVFPLPYHRNAFAAAQLGEAVAAYNRSQFFDYTDFIFSAQQKWFNAPTQGKTPLAVTNEMCSDAAQALNIPVSVLQNGMVNSDINEASRVSWKYAAGRGIYGTPQYLVNGVVVNEPEYTWTLADWVSFLDNIFAGNGRK